MGHDLPLGEPLDWQPAARPERRELRGSRIVLRPVHAGRDARPLYAHSHPPGGDAAIWTYLPYGPFEGPEQLREMLGEVEHSEDPLFFTLVQGDRPLGCAAYLRIEPEFGVIEIGHVWFGTPLQRTAAATEAIYLLARYALDDLGYRRLEWKCDSLNAASWRAAERFGFTFEGVFRKHMVVKGRNRDTAWFAIIDQEWPPIRSAYEAWLSSENFDPEGRQRRPLGDLIRERVSTRPDAPRAAPTAR